MAAFVTNKERTNYSRICCAIIDLGSCVLRDALNQQIHPTLVKYQIGMCPQQDKRLAGLGPSQMLCINKAASSGSYNDFDITLLYGVIRLVSVHNLRDELKKYIDPSNIQTAIQTCPAPTVDLGTKLTNVELIDVKYALTNNSYNGCKDRLLWKLYKHLCPAPYPKFHPTMPWGDMPNATHITLGDDVERIRVIRNTVYGHIPTTEISDQDFNDQWSSLEDIMMRMDKQIPGRQYKIELDNIKTMCMDESTEKRYHTEIQRLSDEEKNLHTEVNKLVQDVTDMKTNLNELEVECKSQMDTVKDRMDTTEASVHTALRNTQDMVKRSEDELRTEFDIKISNVRSDLEQAERSLHVDIKEERKSVSSEIDSKLQLSEDRTNEKIGTLQADLDNVKDEVEKQKRNSNDPDNIILKRIEEHRQDKTFVVTDSVIEGEKILIQHGVLIYSGVPGNGKTKNALEIMRRFKDSQPELLLLKLTDARNWCAKVNPNVESLVLLEDFLGRSNAEISLVNDEVWRDIYACIKQGKVKVIMTTRKNILIKNTQKLEQYDIFASEHLIDLTSPEHCLSRDNKVDILLQHCNNNNIIMCHYNDEENYQSAEQLDDSQQVKFFEWTLADIVDTDPALGFPLSCYLFAHKRKYTKQGVRFFKKPTQSLVDDINHLVDSDSKDIDKLQYCILSCMLLKGGKLNLKNMDKDMFQKVLEAVQISTGPSNRSLKEAVDKLNHVYIEKVNDSEYEFKHQTILETVAICFYEDNPILLLELCSNQFIEEFARPSSYKESDGEIIVKINKDEYLLLVKKYLKEIEDSYEKEKRKEYLWFMQQPLMDDEEFVNCFMETVRSNEIYKQSVKVCISEIFHAACKSGKLYLVDRLYNMFTKEGITKWNCNVHITALYGHKSTVIWLLDHKLGSHVNGYDLQYVGAHVLNAMVKHPSVKLPDILWSLHGIFKNCDDDTIHALLTRWPDLEKKYILVMLNDMSCFGNYKVIGSILQHRPDVIKQEHLAEAVLWACIGNGTQAVEYLLNLGHPTVNKQKIIFHQNKEKLSFLHVAAFFGRFEVFLKLVELGLTVELKTVNELSVLQMVILGYICQGTGYFVSKFGTARKTSSIMYGREAICFLRNKSQMLSLVCAQLEKKSMARTMNTHVDSSSYRNMFDFFASQNTVDASELDIVIDECGSKLVHYGVIYNDLWLIEMLYKHNKMSLKSKNKENMTGIHLAGFLGRWAILRKLIEAGVSVNDRTLMGLNVLQLATFGFSHQGMFGWVDQNSAPGMSRALGFYHSCLGSAMRFGDIAQYEMIFRCLVHEGDFVATDSDLPVNVCGAKLKHFCVPYNSLAVLELICLKYPQTLSSQIVNEPIPDSSESFQRVMYTPLQLALLMGRSQMFKLLYSLNKDRISDISSLKELLCKGMEYVGREIFVAGASCNKSLPNFLWFLPRYCNHIISFGGSEDYAAISEVIKYHNE